MKPTFLPRFLVLLLCVGTVTTAAQAGAVGDSVEVPIPPAEVMAWLADAPRAIHLSPDVITADLHHKDAAGCSIVDVSTAGLTSPFRYQTRRCALANGYIERLTQSEHFSTNTATWTVEATPTGSRISFSIDAKPTMYVPEWMVEQATLGSIRGALARLRQALLAGKP